MPSKAEPLVFTSAECERLFGPQTLEGAIDRAEQAEARIKELEAQLAEATEAMPQTYYAGRPLHFRIKQMAEGWNRAVLAANELEAECDRYREALEGILEEAGKHATDEEPWGWLWIDIVQRAKHGLGIA